MPQVFHTLFVSERNSQNNRVYTWVPRGLCVLLSKTPQKLQIKCSVDRPLVLDSGSLHDGGNSLIAKN